MAPKRKSDAFEADTSGAEVSDADTKAPKKARVSDAPEASSSKGKKEKLPVEKKKWHEIVLEGEDEYVRAHSSCGVSFNS